MSVDRVLQRPLLINRAQNVCMKLVHVTKCISGDSTTEQARNFKTHLICGEGNVYSFKNNVRSCRFFLFLWVFLKTKPWKHQKSNQKLNNQPLNHQESCKIRAMLMPHQVAIEIYHCLFSQLFLVPFAELCTVHPLCTFVCHETVSGS